MCQLTWIPTYVVIDKSALQEPSAKPLKSGTRGQVFTRTGAPIFRARWMRMCPAEKVSGCVQRTHAMELGSYARV